MAGRVDAGERQRLRTLPGAAALALQRDPLGFFSRLAGRRQPAPFRLGPFRFWLVATPELAEQVYVVRHRSLEKGLAMQRARVLLGNGLLTSAEPLHLRQRRTLQPAFHAAHVPRYAEAIAGEAVTLRESWRDGQVVDLSEEMSRLALHAIAPTLVSARIDADDADELIAAVDAAVRSFDPVTVALAPALLRLPLRRTRRFLEARARLDTAIGRLIAARRGSPTAADDALSLLLVDGASDAALIRDELVTLLLAGYETVAHALAWTFHLLAEDASAEERLHAELASVLGDRAPGAADVPRLQWTRQVVAESLRLYPPSWINSRRALEDFELGGERIRRGDNVVVVVYLVHRDPRHWPDPERFDPERFAPGAERGRHRRAYVPFGAGPRRCIGRDFAWLESTLVVATLAQSWRAHRVGDGPVRVAPEFTLRPKGGLPMRLERRAVL